jgi:hypothetical protein
MRQRQSRRGRGLRLLFGMIDRIAVLGEGTLILHLKGVWYRHVHRYPGFREGLGIDLWKCYWNKDIGLRYHDGTN